MDLLDEMLLTRYIHTFYGYGKYSGRVWLIGMEEAGGRTLEDIQERIGLWERHGSCELEDLAGCHIELGIGEYFRYPVKLQPTWAGLSRVILAIQGKPISDRQVRAYQSKELGRSDGDTCLLELLPLPAPNLKKWLYGQRSSNPILANRETYLKNIAPSRIEHIRSRIAEYHPKIVVFYGSSYLTWWETIVGMKFQRSQLGIHLAKGEQTIFAVIRHPAVRASRREYFVAAGQALAELLEPDDRRRA